MHPVAISGLDQKIICALRDFRIFQQWTVSIAQISGKHHLDLFPVFFQPDFYERRSQQMSRIPETNGNLITYRNLMIIVTWYKMLHHALHIIQVIHGNDFRKTGSSRLPVLPLRLKHLNMRTVTEHNVTQLRRRIGRKHLSPKTLCIQKRQQTGMINMRMCHKHIIDLPRIDRDFLILINIRSLFHTTVYQKIFLSDLYIMAAARYFMRCPQKF